MLFITRLRVETQCAKHSLEITPEASSTSAPVEGLVRCTMNLRNTRRELGWGVSEHGDNGGDSDNGGTHVCGWLISMCN